MTKFIQLTHDVAMAIQGISTNQEVKDVVPAQDRIIVADVSGSMYNELPKIRKHLKSRIKELLKVQDTLTLIWFSSRNEFGIAFEREPIHSLEDLDRVFNLLDKALTPRGLTGFTGPLKEVVNVISRIRAHRADSLVSLFFLSDGYDNQGSAKEILQVCKSLETLVDNAVLVEYGWYCDHDLMTKMAETIGGSLLFSKEFAEYTSHVEQALTDGRASRKKPVSLDNVAKNGYVFYSSEMGTCLVAPDENNTVWLPEDVSSVAYFVERNGHPEVQKQTEGIMWEALAVLSQKGDSDILFSLLRAVADVYLINLFVNCFSKEDRIIFQNEAMAAAKDATLRYREGFDPAAVPKDDAFTVLHMIGLLSSDEQNRLHVNHPEFQYRRIGAARVAVAQEGEWTPSMEIQYDPAGYPLNGIVWAEDRPNVSVRVQYQGTVKLPDSRPANLPEVMDTYTYRNYTIIKDGIVHTRVLPMSLAQDTHAILVEEGVVSDTVWEKGKIFILSFPRMPVINRKMVQSLNAQEFFEKVMQLEALKGAQKVFNDLRKSVAPKTSSKFEAEYGAESTAWLKATAGITEYNGFSPSSTTVKSGDVYPSVEFKVAIKGLSSLPKVADVAQAVAAGKKLKIGEFVMADAVKEIEAYKVSPAYLNAKDSNKALEEWAIAKSQELVMKTRELILQVAQQKFCMLVGHAWFKDAKEYGEASYDVVLPGYGSVPVTANLKAVEVEI